MHIYKDTPWGKPQDHEIVSDKGIVWYSTASHGGYKVDKTLNMEIPEVFRCNDGWYEEDCEWSIVWVFLSCHFNPGQFKVETFLQAQTTLMNWYVHEWQEYNGLQKTRSDKCWDCNSTHPDTNCKYQDIEVYDPIATRRCSNLDCDEVIYKDTLDKDHGYTNRLMGRHLVFCSTACALAPNLQSEDKRVNWTIDKVLNG
jgi:hypothetical protein